MSFQSPAQHLGSIVQLLFDKKAHNILVLDVRGFSSMTDYLIIAEGSVGRHVKALADYVTDTLEPMCGPPLYVEGQKFADWIVIDYGEVFIHLFTPEMREYYRLEQLWSMGKLVNIPINISEDK
jgi:ribosome-associated protein